MKWKQQKYQRSLRCFHRKLRIFTSRRFPLLVSELFLFRNIRIPVKNYIPDTLTPDKKAVSS